MAKLVAIGDSLTQGFASGAITHTELSYPSMIAEAMGLDDVNFRQPNFRGAGGLPCNIEWLARKLEEKYAQNISFFEWIGAVPAMQAFLDEVEDYWERGRGSLPDSEILFHNLAVWGFEVGDAFALSSEMCRQRSTDNDDDFFGIPSEARARTGYRVLNPSQSVARAKSTQISIAKEIATESTIEHLIVFLGANNCLSTVLELEIRETRALPPGPFSNCTLWTQSAFEKEYSSLVDAILSIGAQHVYVATVPHVTIPPITRGVMSHRGRLPDNEKYFDYYTRFWIRDKEFDPKSDPHLRKEEAQYIDQSIDGYNRMIRKAAQDNGWHVVDLCDVLDRLAVRRNHGEVKYPLPTELSDLGVRFFELDGGSSVRDGSGLFSLDGVHPTTCGYTILAQEFINVIRSNEPSIRDINFGKWRRWDALVSSPPRTLDDIFGMLHTLERFFHFSRWYGKPMPSAVAGVLGDSGL